MIKIGGIIPIPIIILQLYPSFNPDKKYPIINPRTIPKLVTSSVLLTNIPLIELGVNSDNSKGPIIIPIPTPKPVIHLPKNKL